MDQIDLEKEREAHLNVLLQFPLYHGTYSNAIPSIQENGLDPILRLWDVEGLKRLSELKRKTGSGQGIHGSFDKGNLEKIYVTSGKIRAMTYALRSPEIWDILQRLDMPQIEASDNLTNSEREEAMEIYNGLRDHFEDSEPWVVTINPNTPEIREMYQKHVNRKESYPWVYDDISRYIDRAMLSLNQKVNSKYLTVEKVPEKFLKMGSNEQYRHVAREEMDLRKAVREAHAIGQHILRSK